MNYKKWLSSLRPIGVVGLMIVFTIGLSRAQQVGADTPIVDGTTFGQQFSAEAGNAVPSTGEVYSPSSFTAGSQSYGNLGFPHAMLYTVVNSLGWPLIGSTAPSGTCSYNASIQCTFDSDCTGGPCTNEFNNHPDINWPINQSVINEYAKCQLMTMPPTPVME